MSLLPFLEVEWKLALILSSPIVFTNPILMSYLRDKLGKSCAWMRRQMIHYLILIQVSQRRIITSNWTLNMGNVSTSEANNGPFGERGQNSSHCLGMVNMHQGVCACLNKVSSCKLLFSGLCLVLIAVSNMAVRAQRKHLRTYTPAVPSVSEQTYITSTCVPISDTLSLRAGPSHQADHYMNINGHWSFAKAPLIEIKRGLSRGCWSVLLYSSINLWHVFTVNCNRSHSFPLGACECKSFNYSNPIKTVQALFLPSFQDNTSTAWFILIQCLTINFFFKLLCRPGCLWKAS